MQINKILLAITVVFLWSCKNDEPYEEKKTDFTLSSFSWLRGTWTGGVPKDSIYYTETWGTDSNGNWTGKGWMLFGKDTVRETLGINKVENRIYYTAKVEGENNGQVSYFQLKDTVGGTFVFGDDEHDFPQVIIYKPISPNRFEATLSGLKGGKPLKKTYTFDRSE